MNRSGQTKIFNKKGEQISSFTEADVQRDKREEQEWLKQGDLTADTCEAGREAAYDERCDEEFCRKLIAKCARDSAKRKGGNIGEIRDQYEMIVLELLAARYTQPDGKRYSLRTVLRGKCETDTALKEFLPKFAKWIGEYVSDCIREHSFGFTSLYRQIVPTHTWTLFYHTVGRELLTALAEEYVRDRAGLMQFLEAALKRWRKIYDPQSLWRVRLLTQQHLGGPKVVAQYVENAGAVSPKTTKEQVAALRQCIKQYRSRDRKAALKRQQAR